MPCDNEDNVLAALLPLLTNGDDNRFRDALGLLLNAAMLLERQNHLRAAPHERTEQRSCVTAMPMASRTRLLRLV